MLKVGVIGAGNLGVKHIKLLKGINEFELVGFYDDNQTLQKNIAQTLNTFAFGCVNDLIRNVNAIKQSKHIFIAKPATNTVNEAKQLLELSLEANVKVQVGHAERFNPAFKAAIHYKPYVY